MKDERILKQLRIIKRNNLFIVLGIAVIGLLIKILLGVHFTQFITEIFFIASVAIVFLITIIYRNCEAVEDERVRQNILRIYDIGFILITMLGVLTYFVSLVFLIALNNVPLFTNSFINTAIFLCLLFSYINIRKNKMTFNHRIIERANFSYYKGVLLRILYLLVYFAGVFLIVNLVKLLFELNINMLAIDIAILLSFVVFSIEYFLFSIYEKIRYQENVEMDEGKYRYLSKNALYLFIIVTIFNVVRTTVNYALLPFIDNPLSASDLLVWINIINRYLQIIKINFIVLTLLMNLIIMKSIKRIHLVFPKFFNMFKVVIWLNFAVSIIFWFYSLFYRLTELIWEDSFILVSKISSYSSITIGIIGYVIAIFIFIFLNVNKIKYRYLIITRVVISILVVYLIPSFLNNLYRLTFQDPIIYITNYVGLLVQIVLTFILFISLSNTIEIKPIDETELLG